jgi:hypothetical protein
VLGIPVFRFRDHRFRILGPLKPDVIGIPASPDYLGRPMHSHVSGGGNARFVGRSQKEKVDA